MKCRKKFSAYEIVCTACNSATALATIGLIIVAIYGFRVNREVVRRQTSMDFCALVYPTLQSQEFIQREQYLISTLSERLEKKKPCSFSKIEDDHLRSEMINYCECLNGIGLLLHEHMIDDGVIVPYIGTKTTILYELIRPYLNQTRLEMAAQQYGFFDSSQNEKIQNAAALYFVHYELLALKMRKEGPGVTETFDKQLKESRKQNQISI